MGKYDVKYSCGHSGTVELFGKMSDRENKLKWMESGVCPECYRKEREDLNAAKNAKAKEIGMPELIGTDKQITWAETIRRKFYENTIEGFKKAEASVDEKTMAIIRASLAYVIKNATSASEWIEYRNDTKSLVAKYKEAYREEAKAKKAEAEEAKAEPEAVEEIAEPEVCTKEGVVKITADNAAVTAKYARDDDFRGIVKNLGYRWNSDAKAWILDITFKDGSAKDRAAELGNALLRAGFAISMKDHDTLYAAVRADFSPHQRKWISMLNGGEYSGWLCITWNGRNDEYYKRARQISGSRWNGIGVIVPTGSWAEALDFADVNGFSVSNGAQSGIERYRESVKIVVPDEPEKQGENTDKLKEILDSDMGVIDDLKD